MDETCGLLRDRSAAAVDTRPSLRSLLAEMALALYSISLFMTLLVVGVRWCF
jgi:hypothetical protein